jgi:hypothetical protein
MRSGPEVACHLCQLRLSFTNITLEAILSLRSRTPQQQPVTLVFGAFSLFKRLPARKARFARLRFGRRNSTRIWQSQIFSRVPKASADGTGHLREHGIGLRANQPECFDHDNQNYSHHHSILCNIWPSSNESRKSLIPNQVSSGI